MITYLSETTTIQQHNIIIIHNTRMLYNFIGEGRIIKTQKTLFL